MPNRPNNGPRLPVEFFRIILSHVTQRHVLYALSQSCRLFQAESERLLYRSVYLHPIRQHRLCDAVANLPRVHHLVQACTLFASVEDDSAVDRTIMRRARLRCAASLMAVKKMHHLLSLTMQGNLSDWTYLIRGVQFRLKHFCAFSTPDPGLALFLDTQRDLQELVIYSGNPNDQPVARLSGSLRRLQKLISLTPEIPCQLVQARPIVALEICCWLDASVQPTMARLGRSTAPIAALLISQGFRIGVKDLYSVATHLPSLRFLGELCLNEPALNFLQPLSMFRQLETVLINQQSLASTLSTQILLNKIQQRCPSIKRVVFCVVLYPFQLWELRYRRWKLIANPPPNICHDMWSDFVPPALKAKVIGWP